MRGMVGGSIIDYNDSQSELEGLFHDLPHLVPMVENGNDNGAAGSSIHRV